MGWTGAVLGLLAMAPSAGATLAGTYECRASAVRVESLAGTAEPSVANRATKPCRAQQTAPAPAQSTSPAGTVEARLVSARTGLEGTDPPQDGNTVHGRADLTAFSLTNGSDVVRADAVTAEVRNTCVGGVPVEAVTTSVRGLTVGGQPIAVPDGERRDIPLANGVLHVNAPIAGGVRTLWYEGLTGDVIAAEALVRTSGNPCVEGAPPPPPPPPPPPLPDWACRATVVKTFVPYLGITPLGPAFEPAVASTGLTPCKQETDRRLGPVVRPSAGTAAGGPRASTSRDHTSARAEAEAGSVVLRSGDHVIQAEDLVARAEADCSSGTLLLSARSRVGRLFVDGRPYALSDSDLFPGEQVKIPIDARTTLYVNWRIDGPDRIARRALWLTTTGSGDVVAGEARVGLPSGCP